MTPPHDDRDPGTGNTECGSNALLTGWVSLNPRCRFCLAGPDRVRYLNGQITNQVEGLEPGTSRYACLTNHKGQLESDLWVTASATATTARNAGAGSETLLFIDADPALRDALHTRLDRYIIADDVTLEDVTDQWMGWHILGRSAVIEDLRSALPGASFSQTARYGLQGTDVWVPAQSPDANSGSGASENTDVLSARIEEVLAKHGWEPIPSEALEWARLSNGIARWGAELTEGRLPPEARLEARAIDYEKGCYIGQEVISRIKSVGKVNRLLSLMRWTGPSDLESAHPLPQAGAEFWPAPTKADTDTRASKGTGTSPLGTFTSVAVRPESSPREILALGYLKSQHAAPGTLLSTSPPHSLTENEEQPPHQLIVLPFPSPSP